MANGSKKRWRQTKDVWPPTSEENNENTADGRYSFVSWYLVRMDKNRNAKKLMKWQPQKWKQGIRKPRIAWKNNCKQDLDEIDINL